MDPNSKKSFSIIAAIIIVATFGVFIFINQDKIRKKDSIEIVFPTTETRTEILEKIEAPDETTEDVPENIAQPIFTREKTDSVNSSLKRIFKIKAEDNKFIPDTIVVNQGDTLSLEITAVDQDYDFVQPDYGLTAKISEGETLRGGFQAADPGKFTFYCEICGGLEEGAKGYIIVNPM